MLNGDPPFSAQLLGRAHELSRAGAIVDIVMKPQIALNLANVLRLIDRQAEALSFCS